MLLNPENTLFVRGATPVLLLADAPVNDALPLLAAPDDAGASGDMADWCEDAERVGGAVVLSLDWLPDMLDWSVLLSSGTVRGGFMSVPA
ncbi:hypothetical protein [Streptomyces mirabilis]